MFYLNVRSPHGVEAEFHVDSAAMALDLALRSGRAGFVWRAESRVAEPHTALTLGSLREWAAASAETDEDRRLLDQIEWQHELHDSALLN